MRFAFILSSLMVVPLAAQEKKIAPLTAKDLDVIWQEHFIQQDDEGARQALLDIRRMVEAPPLAVAFLKSKLKAAPTADDQKIAGYLADLDSSSFEAREKAMKELETLGALVGPALDKKLREETPLEVRQRLETLQKRIDSRGLTADDLRSVRGISVLEGIGNPEAKAVLEVLAKGGQGAVTTEQARQALANLAGRGK